MSEVLAVPAMRLTMPRWRVERRGKKPPVYHQHYSAPLLDGLKAWLQKQFDERLVEPNSSLCQCPHAGALGDADAVLHLPGAPIDTNLCERALKLFIRQRKNSLR